jgi:hypothetical protein
LLGPAMVAVGFSASSLLKTMRCFRDDETKLVVTWSLAESSYTKLLFWNGGSFKVI